MVKRLMAEKNKTKTPENEGADDLHKRALERYRAGWERDRENIEAAYADLQFYIGEGQWSDDIKRKREAEGRPCLTVNRLPQFVRQITGDIRQMRPGIKCVPVDDRGDPDTADVLAGLIRYVENRSAASSVYFKGADSQVQAGIGHWRVLTEYASETTFNQELRIASIDDGVAVIWDPDASETSRADAGWCFVPVDMSRAAFKAKYPDAQTDASVGDGTHKAFQGWFTDDSVRVCEYWYKEPRKRTLLLAEGAVIDLTDKDPEEIAEAEEMVRLGMKQGRDIRIETREGFCVHRAVISGAEVLEEPTEWKGRYIPIIPVIGEEVRIGRRVFRHGAIRHARDPQSMFNYYISAQTEVVALQPKAPFIGTEAMFEGFEAEWETANTENLAYLRYNVDKLAPQMRPERSQPPVSSQGITEGIQLAAENLQATTGIYNASLGAQSNETSGKAIMARQREGDTGTFVYVDNFGQAVAHTGRVIADLIPHVYDTTRTMRIIGEDGKEDLVDINKPVSLADVDPETGEALQTIENDVTVGAYDVVMQMGPSYATRREEAREGMTAFLQGAGEAGMAIIDLVAKAQDWPNAEEVGERLELLLPPPIQAKIREEKGEEPAPEEIAMQQAQAELAQGELALKSKEQAVMAAELQVRELQAQQALAALQAGLPVGKDGMIQLPEPQPQEAAPSANGAPQPPQELAQPVADPHEESIATLAEAVADLQGIVAHVVTAMQGGGAPQPPPEAQPMPPDPAAPPGAVSMSEPAMAEPMPAAPAAPSTEEIVSGVAQVMAPLLEKILSAVTAEKEVVFDDDGTPIGVRIAGPKQPSAAKPAGITLNG